MPVYLCFSEDFAHEDARSIRARSEAVRPGYYPDAGLVGQVAFRAQSRSRRASLDRSAVNAKISAKIDAQQD